MTNNRSAKKRIVQSEKRRKKNISIKSMIRTFIKKVNIAIYNKDKEKALQNFYILQSIIDRQANKGIIHRNKAARHKSNLSKKIDSM